MSNPEPEPYESRYRFDNLQRINEEKLLSDYQAYLVGALCLSAEQISSGRTLKARQDQAAKEFSQLLDTHGLLVSTPELSTAV